MEYQKRRKHGDYIHYINRDNSKIKRQKVLDENQTKIISENIRIRPLINNFSEQKIKDRKYPKPINIKCSLFKKNNFILSKEAMEKCNKVYHYMIYQVPCILEGETGTSKSFTASMMAKYRQWQIIEDEKEEERKNGIKKREYTEFKFYKFSLSKETKISDLFGKYTGSSDSLYGIIMAKVGVLCQDKNESIRVIKRI